MFNGCFLSLDQILHLVQLGGYLESNKFRVPSDLPLNSSKSLKITELVANFPKHIFLPTFPALKPTFILYLQ